MKKKRGVGEKKRDTYQADYTPLYAPADILERLNGMRKKRREKMVRDQDLV